MSNLVQQSGHLVREASESSAHLVRVKPTLFYGKFYTYWLGHPIPYRIPMAGSITSILAGHPWGRTSWRRAAGMWEYDDWFGNSMVIEYGCMIVPVRNKFSGYVADITVSVTSYSSGANQGNFLVGLSSTTSNSPTLDSDASQVITATGNIQFTGVTLSDYIRVAYWIDGNLPSSVSGTWSEMYLSPTVGITPVE